MSIPDDLLEIKYYEGAGYQPMVDYGEWRVAILRFDDELLPENISNMQRHDETDEVFVLLEGRCILFLGSGSEVVEDIFAVDMEPNRLYNVRKSCLHNHTLSRDAVVLIVENRDTTLENSPRVEISSSQQDNIKNLVYELWGRT